MNNIFKYSGIICLAIFSFFYTEKAVDVANSKDPIMQSIMNYESDKNTECIEGTLRDEGVVLGVSGFKVNVNRSYSNMKGLGYDEELMVFDENKCEVTKEKVRGKYIISGNSAKESISLLIFVENGNYLDKIISIADEKQIKLSIIVNGDFLEANKNNLKVAYEKGHDLLYSGNLESDLKKYKSNLRGIDKESEKYCVYNNDDDLIKMCEKNKFNTIKTDIIIEKDLLMNIKDYVNKGNLIILKENENIVKELGASINFIKAKGINIKTISSHLSEEL